jgi:hypothetical protein
MPRRGLRPTAPRSRAGKVALFALALGALGYVCARLIILLADVRPYVGWYLLLAVACGIVVAVALPWILASGFRASPRWAGWLLLVYTGALVGGMRYYLSLRYTPPSSVPAVLPPPPWWFVLEIAGLAAVAFTVVATTLLTLVVLVGVIVPGPIGRWLRAWRTRRAHATPDLKNSSSGDYSE